jgi:RNA polymerase sigma factor (sigma-70 family)
LLQEQQEIEREIEETRIYISAVVIDDMPKGTGLSNPTEELIMRLSKLYTMLLYKKNQIVDKRMQIEAAIDTLPSRERRLMRLFYIDGLSLEEIANIMYYSINHIWRLHGQVLNKMRGNNSC